MTKHSDAPDPEVGGAADDYPEHTIRLRQDLAEWYGSTGYADAEIDYQRLGILAEIDQIAQWDREARDVRRYANSITPVPPDLVATAYLRDMLRYEDEGRVEWVGDQWRLPTRQRPVASWSFTPLTADQLLAHFEKVRQVGDGWVCRCPSHEDRSPSLSIKLGDKWWLTHCFAGCSTEAICAAVGLDVSALALGIGEGR